jgi:putative transcriptional regulator
MRLLPIAVAVLFSQAAVRVASSQSMRPADLGEGKMLVASRDLGDPNFVKTVVLLVHYDEEGVLGLILNRRSNVPISRVLDDIGEAKGRSDPVYAGGPVAKTGILALSSFRGQGTDAKPVFGDVYLVSSKELLQKSLAATVESGKLHVYLGYAGWTVEQLEREVDLGAWYIFPGNTAAIFDSDPDSLWSRLIRETEMGIAAVIHRN